MTYNTTLHYSTLHYTTLHTTLHYTTLLWPFLVGPTDVRTMRNVLCVGVVVLCCVCAGVVCVGVVLVVCLYTLKTAQLV